jgi:hypothetical protein
MRIASSINSRPLRNDSMPSCGNADDLQVDQVAAFLADFEHGFERGELRVGDVDVGAHVLNAVGGQRLNGFLGAGLGVFFGDGDFALAPAFDAFEQRAAHVPARLASGQRGVEVNVRLDEGRHHQIAAGVEVIRAEGRCFGLPGDVADQTVFKVQFVQTFLVAQTGVDDVHQANPFL